MLVVDALPTILGHVSSFPGSAVRALAGLASGPAMSRVSRARRTMIYGQQGVNLVSHVELRTSPRH